jgi:RNA polymerase sigma factor (sigma-70 family)
MGAEYAARLAVHRGAGRHERDGIRERAEDPRGGGFEATGPDPTAAMTPTEISQFEELVHTHHAAVFASARRVLRDDAAAADATQEVFLRVLGGRLDVARLDEESTRRVLCWWSVHCALNERRGNRRRRAREERIAMTRNERTHAPEHDHDDDRRLWDLVDELPEELRVPLVLRFAENLGFARIGELLGLAESTAHERVTRGLAKLRARIAQAGLVALAAGTGAQLEARLASAASAAVVAPPAGLVTRLVGLESARASVSLGLVASLAVGALTLGGGAWWWFESGEPPRNGVELAATSNTAPSDAGASGEALAATEGDSARAALVAPQETPPPATENGDESQALSGEALGRVLDSDGVPIVGAQVTVVSVERDGKFAAYAATVVSDASGSFRTSVDVADAEGGLYFVQITHAGCAITSSAPQRIRAGAATDFGLVTLTAPSGETSGSYSLAVEVVDTFGVAVESAVVELASVVDLPVDPGTLWTDWYSRETHLERIDGRAVTDASGAAHFEVDGIGAKLVRVKPVRKDLAPFVTRFDVAADEAARLVLVAEPACSISGSLLVVDGVFAPTMQHSLQAYVREPISAEWLFADIADDGAFTIDGLPLGTHRVEVHPNHASGDDTNWSPAAIEVVITPDLRASSGHVVRLKRRDDPRDVGDHMGEIHGRLVRAEDGQPLVVDFWAVELDLVPELEPLAFTRDWLPNHVFPGPAQRSSFGPEPDDTDVFHMVGLDAGRYVLRCTTNGRASLVHGPIDVTEHGIVSDLVLPVEVATRVAGRVFTADGEPLDGAYVMVTGHGPISDEKVAAFEQALRAADGRGWLYGNGTEVKSTAGAWEIGALPSGIEFRLVALHPEHATVFGPTFTLEPGEARTDFELRFTR